MPMVIMENLTPADNEAGLREELQRTEQKLFDLCGRIADIYGYYSRLREELEQIAIFGAEDYYSQGKHSDLPISTATSGYDF